MYCCMAVESSFQSQTRRLLPRNFSAFHLVQVNRKSFNRRRDACFPATCFGVTVQHATNLFQSQTRRLLPRNVTTKPPHTHVHKVSIADATHASPQRHGATLCCSNLSSFNRRRDACFPATSFLTHAMRKASLFQSQTRRLLPRNFPVKWRVRIYPCVSIADATLASPQPGRSP